MNLADKTSSSKITPKLTYDVLIENQPDGTVKATLLGLPDCQALGSTEAEAIEKIRQTLQNRLETSKMVTLEIDTPISEHPWLKFAGMHKDNPLFEEAIAYIETERNLLDSNMEEVNEKFRDEIHKEFEELGITDANSIMKAFLLRQRTQSIPTNDNESENILQPFRLLRGTVTAISKPVS
jgi:predicted RNase H-like HicB family nuclease